MLGFLLYFISTIAYIPHAALFLLFIYILLFRRKKVRKIVQYEKRTLYQIVVFVSIALVYFFIGSVDPDQQLEFPYFLPIIITFFIGATLDEKDLRIVVYCLIVESFIGIAEFSSGVSSFLPGVTEISEFEEENLLYFQRVMGLCKGSSTFAIHLLLGLLLLHYQRKNIPGYLLYSIVICIAFLCTFNRTVLLVGIPFEVYIVYCYVNERFSKVKYIKHLFGFFVIVGALALIYIYKDIILFQLTRGGTDNVMTGRPLIWHNYAKFIEENFLCGNFGYRTLLPYYGVPNHAHNSFIQLAANVGIPLALFYLFIIVSKIRKFNFIYIFPIFLTSMAQYEIFWGISFADILLFYFISNNMRLSMQKM